MPATAAKLCAICGSATLLFAAFVAATISFVVLDEAKAQHGPTSSQSAASAGTAENDGQDFTRPANLFQLRYVYQTAPGTGAVPGSIRTVTTDRAVLRLIRSSPPSVMPRPVAAAGAGVRRHSSDVPPASRLDVSGRDHLADRSRSGSYC